MNNKKLWAAATLLAATIFALSAFTKANLPERTAAGRAPSPVSNTAIRTAAAKGLSLKKAATGLS
jgi:hypothetical protein